MQSEDARTLVLIIAAVLLSELVAAKAIYNEIKYGGGFLEHIRITQAR